MAYILSTKHARKSDSDFVVAAARAFYVDWYLSNEKRERRVSEPGVELTEVCPETQRWAFKLARDFARQIEEAYKLPLGSILDKWAEYAEAYPYRDRDADETDLGWYAAMGAMGHGVGLSTVFGIEADEVPSIEAYPR